MKIIWCMSLRCDVGRAVLIFPLKGTVASPRGTRWRRSSRSHCTGSWAEFPLGACKKLGCRVQAANFDPLCNIQGMNSRGDGEPGYTNGNQELCHRMLWYQLLQQSPGRPELSQPGLGLPAGSEIHSAPWGTAKTTSPGSAKSAPVPARSVKLKAVQQSHWCPAQTPILWTSVHPQAIWKGLATLNGFVFIWLLPSTPKPLIYTPL